MFKRILSLAVIVCFFLTTLSPLPKAHADTVLGLPAPGAMVNLSPGYVPIIIKGLRVHPENPILFDFIVDTGNSGLLGSNPQLKIQSEKLIKYFLASLTIPEDDLWVNLSPYEKNRIIPDQLGQTEMGRDMLAEDYILKQLTASLIYPEKNLGREFWNKVYAKAQQQYGTSEIPVNTFNKVWIVANKAKVYVHDNTAFVVASHLKVMLEEDYLSLGKHNGVTSNNQITDQNKAHSIGSQIVREIVLPELEKEVNIGKNFANLRQIFHSMILAAWYKKNLKEALLNQVYSNKSKINGVNVADKTIKEQIYKEYLKAYKKGVFNYIKEDIQNGQTIPRKYFSGGEVGIRGRDVQEVGISDTDAANFSQHPVDGAMFSVNAAMTQAQNRSSDAAMTNVEFIGNQINKLEENYQQNTIEWGKIEANDANKGKVFASIEATKTVMAELLQAIDDNQPLRDAKDKIQQAIGLVFDKQGQSLRKDLKFYPIHPLQVALSFIKELGITDPNFILSALLHDSIEDIDEYTVNPHLIGEMFGPQVQANVESVTNKELSADAKAWLTKHIIQRTGINPEADKEALKAVMTIIEYQLGVTSEIVGHGGTLLLKSADFSDNALKQGNLAGNPKLQSRLSSKYRDLIRIFKEEFLKLVEQEEAKGASANAVLIAGLRKRADDYQAGYQEVSGYAGSWEYADTLNKVVAVIDEDFHGLQGLSDKIKKDFAMTAEQIETLKGAETEISKILEGQFQRGDITEIVYKNALKNTYQNLYEWTTDEDIYRIDPSIRQTNLEAISQGRWDDIIEAYRQEVAFGTAGIRGKAVLTFDDLQKFVKEGPLGNFLKGPNTINAFKLLKTTAGVIRFAKETGRKKIVVGYDSRIGGEQFALMIARLFIAQSTPDHQFKIFLFDEASPFPELSFGITTEDVKGDIGILLSASHNPADYNGYKITLGNGSQLNQKSKDTVVAAIAKVKNPEIVLANSVADAKPGQIVWLGADEPLAGKDYYGFERIDMHSLHVQQTKQFILNPQAVADYGKEVHIGYAAFNGAGYKAVPRLLRETGFTNFKVITKLQKLDGTFPAWKFGEQPDPGDPISADIAVREFIEEHGQKAFDDLDILIGTDPDADRMGLIVKVPEAQQKLFGKYRLLSANDAWTLLLWYRLTMKKQMGLLQNPANHTIVFSHVTTDALEAVAREFGIEPAGKMLDMSNTQDRGDYLSGRRTWVGFTYLSEALEEMEQAGRFVEMLAEESNGVSIQGHTKEKDGTLAAVLLAEIAAYAKSQNTTIFGLLDKVYSQIGHYATANKALPRVGSFEKAAGISEKIKIIQKSEEWGHLANERAGTANPFMIAGKKVIGAVQFASGRIDKSHYEGVPDEGVRFFFEDETMKPGDNFTNSRNYITIRASGTSQALRFYTQIFTKESTPEQKAFNYHEAERIALEAQKQILEDVGLAKHLSLVTQQLESFNTPVADKAALTKTPVGGIDLNAQNMQMDVSGQKINIHFDSAMVAQFRRGNFSGVSPVIMNITPIVNVMPWLKE